MKKFARILICIKGIKLEPMSTGNFLIIQVKLEPKPIQSSDATCKLIALKLLSLVAAQYTL